MRKFLNSSELWFWLTALFVAATFWVFMCESTTGVTKGAFITLGLLSLVNYVRCDGDDYNRDEIGFTVEDVDLFRQWFESVQDVSPDYLHVRDYDLAVRVYESIGRKVSLTVQGRTTNGTGDCTVQR